MIDVIIGICIYEYKFVWIVGYFVCFGIKLGCDICVINCYIFFVKINFLVL